MYRKLTAILFTLSLFACDDETGPTESARITVAVTDAPSDYVESAELWVSAVYLQGPADDDSDGDGIDDGEDDDVAGRLFLFEDSENPRNFDLLTLREGVTETLAEFVEVDPGSFAQLRFVVDSAFVTLVEGFEFADGETTAMLMVPSGSRSGVKVNLTGPIEADEGEEVTIVVDIDVDQNFVIQGNPEVNPTGIQGILFTPSLQEIERTEEGV